MTLSLAMAPLAKNQRWMNWMLEHNELNPAKPRKVPISPRTGYKCKPTDPANWCSYEEALAAAHQRGHGLAYQFNEGDGFWFLDIDNCLQPDGQWTPLAQHLMSMWGGHVAIEVSQSGKGLHIFGWASQIPPHGCRNIPLGLELYHTDRFVAFTDHQSCGAMDMDTAPMLAELVVGYFPRTSTNRDVVDWTETGHPYPDGPTSDDEKLLAMMLASGKRSVGAFFNDNQTPFADLWHADADVLAKRWPGQNGHDPFDRSSADSALANHLIFWTSGNCERTERLMRRSALARDKWDDREDYLERTILKACTFVKNRAGPREAEKASSIAIIPGEWDRMATEAGEALMAAGIPIFQRGGVLVHPITTDMAAAGSHKTKVVGLAPISVPLMMDYLSRAARFTKFDGRKQETVQAHPPETVARILLARQGEWPFPHIVGVMTAPTIRPDGSLLATPGYDPVTRLLLVEPPHMPPIPDAPSQTQACAALEKLHGLLKDFPFADDASRSVSLSALISPVVRGAFPNVPLHAITAPTAGSGKSFLVDLAAGIVTGDRAPVLSAAEKVEETDKRLTGALLEGSPIISLDNVNADLYSDLLAQAVERPLVNLRPLGTSTMVKVESRSTIFATGNNLRLVSDMARRTLVCSLDPGMERPELRRFDTNPFSEVIAHRGEYLAAALTIVRAHVVAGMPGKLSPLASFEGWSNMVRSALVWLGQTDPVTTQEKARATDPTVNQLGAILSALHMAFGSEPRLTKVIVETANLSAVDSVGHVNENLREALMAVAPDGRGGIDNVRLGRYLRRHQDRIIGGFRLDSQLDGKTGQPKWSAVLVSDGRGGGG